MDLCRFDQIIRRVGFLKFCSLNIYILEWANSDSFKVEVIKELMVLENVYVNYNYIREEGNKTVKFFFFKQPKTTFASLRDILILKTTGKKSSRI